MALYAPAETTDYMILGFIFIYGPTLIYVLSLMSRRRKLEKEHKILEDLDK